MQNDLEVLAARYYQLSLPIREGERHSPEYESAVLCGERPESAPAFNCPEEIRLSTAETPAGTAEILYFGQREDFVHAMRALAYRCEPAEIMDSVGASTIKGLINWEKIHRHKEEYIAAGGLDWGEEFSRFTADKNHYLDTVILLSGGDYSNVPASDLGLDPAVWKEKSYTIRRFHELTHFVCRGLYPQDIDALRDEVIADSMGLTAAFGHYDTALARRFLGIEGGVYREGGRLGHYVKTQELDEAVKRCNALIEEYAARIAAAGEQRELFTLLLKIFP